MVENVRKWEIQKKRQWNSKETMVNDWKYEGFKRNGGKQTKIMRDTKEMAGMGDEMTTKEQK